MEKHLTIDVSEIEDIVDDAFFNTEIPHPLRDLAIWHLLTAAEDQTRMLFSGWFKNTSVNILDFTNNYKFSLRHGMSYIIKSSLNEKITLPSRTIPQSYVKSSTLLIAGTQYERLSRIIASVYNDRATIFKSEPGYKIEYCSSMDLRYSVLEALGHGGEPPQDIVGLLNHWLTNDDSESKIILSKILEQSRVRKGKVIYEYNPLIAHEILQYIPQRDEIIPREFTFPWGSAFETQALINSLLIRCFYHVFTIDKVAREKKLKGGAESSLLLTISRQQLCLDLEEFASFDKENILKFIDFFTFGNGTKTPDPALQPLFQTKSDVLLVPCFHILTSNLQRNVLALMARTKQKHFDRQSKLFEDTMVDNLSHALSKWPHVLLNKEYKIGGQKEEIDVLILDEKDKTILALELRWMLQPGDAREVYNRIKVCGEKVKQLERKLQFVSMNKTEIVARSCPELEKKVDLSDWSVIGLVVIQGFGGAISPNPDIPIITNDILSEGLKRIQGLKTLYNWISSLSWLPKKDVHFLTQIEEEEINGFIISRPAAIPRVSPQEYAKAIRDDILAIELV